jgi:hypothetical protein
MANHDPPVPSNVDVRPRPHRCWDTEPREADMDQVHELVVKIQEVKENGLVGVVVMINFATCRLRPLKE